MKISPAARLQARRRRRARTMVARALLAPREPRPLGHGAYSSAFSVGPRLVLKVTDLADLSVPWFGRWWRANPGVHWPRVHRLGRSRRHWHCWMERLAPIIAFKPQRLVRIKGMRGYNTERFRAADGAINLVGLANNFPLEQILDWGEDLAEGWDRCPARLRRPILKLRYASRRAGLAWDLKINAFMWRAGGTLVCADPLLPSD